MANLSANKPSLVDSIREEFQSQELTSIVLSSIVIGAVQVLIVTSLAALVFSGPLAVFSPRAIGLWLMGGLIIGVINTLTSSFRGAISSPQDSPAAVVAVLAAALVNQLDGQVGIEQVFYTVMGAMVISSLLTGLVFFILGHFRLGNLIRFIPYPVIGGFLAGSGWLLVVGAFGVMVDLPQDLADVRLLFGAAPLIRWLPPMLFGLLIVILLRKIKHSLALPLLLISTFAVFYLVLLISGTPFSAATADGWLLGGGGQKITWDPLTPKSFASVNWGAVLSQGGAIFTILVTSLVGMLLNASGMEVAARKSVDINRELKAAGSATFASGLLSGPIGYPAISLSTLSVRMGVESRLIGLFSAGMYAVALLFGDAFLSYFPTPVLATMLFFFGISFLVDWLYAGWKKLSRTDYALVVLILIIVAVFGFLPGILTGLVLAVLIFVVNYSRVDVVTYQLTGQTYRSRVERRQPHIEVLNSHGEEIFILKLRGYIFFGTANNLLQRIRTRIGAPDQVKPLFIILDFFRVTALDSSAVNSFILMHQFARENNIVLVLSDLNPELRKLFLSEGIDPENEPLLRFSEDLDHGMEWCEDRLLHEHGFGDTLEAKGIAELFTEVVGVSESDLGRILSYFVLQQVEEKENLIVQGEPPKALYYLDSGELTVLLEQDDGDLIRLGKLGPGTIVGEIQVYLDRPASASVMVTSPSTVYQLTSTALKSMESEAPELAAAFHKHIVKLLGQRLVRWNGLLDAIMD